jgi:hypothetical protein
MVKRGAGTQGVSKGVVALYRDNWAFCVSRSASRAVEQCVSGDKGENVTGISRRKVLGYTSTAAAGGILATAGTAGSAHAADADPAPNTAAGAVTYAEQASADSVTWATNNVFKAFVSLPGEEEPPELTISFSLDIATFADASADITPYEVASALSALAESRGWPPLQFYGSPAPVPLTSAS